LIRLRPDTGSDEAAPALPVGQVEDWARRHFEVVRQGSIERTYTGQGPPSWRSRWPEVERQPAAHRPADWWHMARLLDAREALGRPGRLLDLGCGVGWPAVPLSDGADSLIALDAARLAVRKTRAAARRRSCRNLRVLRGDAAHLPFPDACFDAVSMSNLMNVVRRPSAVAREALRVLKPGGRLVGRVQNFRYVLGGENERRTVTVTRDGPAFAYTYRRATVAPPHWFEITFTGSARTAPRVPAGRRRAGVEMVLAELERLRPALAPRAVCHGAEEYLPETAGARFEAAGFADVRVSPLSAEMARGFARDLERRHALPTTRDEFEERVGELLTGMRRAGFDAACTLSVTARRPD
jgi:SAM-dependent methyltransferase